MFNRPAGTNLGRHKFIDITPDPLLARLNGAHQWMLGGMKMFGRVFVL
jgi:hypothetical protein